jgi:hypothetical protein
VRWPSGPPLEVVALRRGREPSCASAAARQGRHNPGGRFSQSATDPPLCLLSGDQQLALAGGSAFCFRPGAGALSRPRQLLELLRFRDSSSRPRRGHKPRTLRRTPSFLRVTNVASEAARPTSTDTSGRGGIGSGQRRRRRRLRWRGRASTPLGHARTSLAATGDNFTNRSASCKKRQKRKGSTRSRQGPSTTRARSATPSKHHTEFPEVSRGVLPGVCVVWRGAPRPRGCAARGSLLSWGVTGVCG